MRYLIPVVFLYFASQIQGQNATIPFSGDVKFVSDASLEIIKAESSKLVGIVDLTDNKFAFSVKLLTLEGFNSALQKEHFNENYMETTKYPTITYTGKLLDEIPINKDGKYQIRTKGKFSIRGIIKERILNHDVTVTNGQIQIASNFKILLEDYNINIPKIVHKKIAEEIQISISAKSGK